MASNIDSEIKREIPRFQTNRQSIESGSLRNTSTTNDLTIKIRDVLGTIQLIQQKLPGAEANSNDKDETQQLLGVNLEGQILSDKKLSTGKSPQPIERIKSFYLELGNKYNLLFCHLLCMPLPSYKVQHLIPFVIIYIGSCLSENVKNFLGALLNILTTREAFVALLITLTIMIVVSIGVMCNFELTKNLIHLAMLTCDVIAYGTVIYLACREIITEISQYCGS